MPDEPLIFVWVALVNGISASVQSLLDENAPLGDAQSADTAVFYSISNAQSGLLGINFGNFLVKRVVDSLSKELPNLKTFATLSPIPGFSSWFEKKMTEGTRLFLDSEQSRVLTEFMKTDTVERAIKNIIQENNWYNDQHLVSLLREPLTKICAEYLLLEKRESGTAFDSVAHFHLNNGASMEQLNWMADTSLRGIDQSYGLMINYLYDLKLIDANHEIYRVGEAIAASQTVRNLAKR
jgi:malonyl-CoA decarboxylase